MCFGDDDDDDAGDVNEHCCLCFPLALGVLVSSVLLIGLGGLDIWSAARTPDPNAGTYIVYVIAAIKILGGLCGILAVLFKSAKLAQMVQKGLCTMNLCICAQLISQWITWIVDMTDDEEPWHPNNKDIVVMSVFTALNLIMMGLICYMKGKNKDFTANLKAGGNGWGPPPKKQPLKGSQNPKPAPPEEDEEV